MSVWQTNNKVFKQFVLPYTVVEELLNTSLRKYGEIVHICSVSGYVLHTYQCLGR